MAISKAVKTRRIVVGIICIALFFSAFFLALYAYQNDLTQRSSGYSFGVDEKEPNRISLPIGFLAVDPIKGDLSIRIAPIPHGSFAIGETDIMSTDLNFYASIEGGKGDLQIKKKKISPSVDGTLSLFNGRVTDYPFDTHEAEIYLYFSNPKDEKQSIPMEVDFIGALPGYNIDTDIIKGFDSAEEIGVKIKISRSIITKAFAMFILIAMWLVPLAVLFMALAVLLQNRPAELGMFAYMGALLFALPAVRNIQPGIPPVGTLTDFLSFFWAELLVAIAQMIIFYCWFTRYKPKDS
ncbi:DUF4436 domain-containing protein [Tumidithrix helvetica PCC 7403]|uniref:DUF4436 family protein n=1 Tax=Tumidithrix helvetica TaxID=3457545 RepID=UPI003CB4DAB2